MLLRSWLASLVFTSFALAADCEKQLFDLSLAEPLSIEDSLGDLASYCSFSIIIKDELARTKLAQIQRHLNVHQQSLTELFALLIEGNNLHYEFDGRALIISGLETRIFRISYITSVREGQSITKASVDAKPRQMDYMLSEEVEDNMIKSMEKFDFWQNIEKELSALLAAAALEGQEVKPPIINQNAGIIIITGTRLQLERVRDYLQRLENRLKKQVIIDVSIIAVALSKSHSNGINWQNFSLGSNAKNSSGDNSFVKIQSGEGFVKNLGFNVNLNFDSILNFLSQNGRTEVLSNPKLMALNNQQAIISVGDTINYQVKESSKGTENGTTVSESYSNYSIFVGILLNILPEISDEGKIMLRINPSLSDFKYPEDNKRQLSPRAIAPDTTQKKLSTVVQVENNQSLILGGLISHNKSEEGSSVNFLSKIPLLGLLFQSDEQVSNASEIVFIITPSIVDNAISSPSLKELGFKSIYN